MKKTLLILLALLVPASAFAASSTDYLLQREASNIGQGAVTWNNTTPFVMAYAYTTGTNTVAVDTDEAFTVVSAYGGTETCFTVTISSTATTAVAGTVTWSSGDVLTLESQGESKNTDCTGVTLTACIAAANALTHDSAALNVSFTITAGSTLTDSSFTDYYEPENASDLAATAVSTGGTTTATIAQGSATRFDSAGSMDCTNKSLSQCAALIEAMYGGTIFAVTIADGINSDLANGFNDVANLGATDMEGTGAAIPMTAGGAAIDYLEEDRFKLLSSCNYASDLGTAGTINIYDGSTLIWKQAAVDDAGADAWTNVRFDPPLSATGSNYLNFQIFSSDALTAGSIYCVGRID